jgi:hypothetical protein
LAEESEPHIRSSTEQREWLAKLDTEHDNLRATLAWCRFESGDAGIGVRLAGALSWFWEDHGHLGEGRRWLEWALQANDTATATARVKLLNGLGTHARRQGDLARAAALHEEGVALARAQEDKWSVAVGLGALGITARQRATMTVRWYSSRRVSRYFGMLPTDGASPGASGTWATRRWLAAT